MKNVSLFKRNSLACVNVLFFSTMPLVLAFAPSIFGEKEYDLASVFGNEIKSCQEAPRPSIVEIYGISVPCEKVEESGFEYESDFSFLDFDTKSLLDSINDANKTKFSLNSILGQCQHGRREAEKPVEINVYSKDHEDIDTYFKKKTIYKKDLPFEVVEGGFYNPSFDSLYNKELFNRIGHALNSLELDSKVADKWSIDEKVEHEARFYSCKEIEGDFAKIKVSLGSRINKMKRNQILRKIVSEDDLNTAFPAISNTGK